MKFAFLHLKIFICVSSTFPATPSQDSQCSLKPVEVEVLFLYLRPFNKLQGLVPFACICLQINIEISTIFAHFDSTPSLNTWRSEGGLNLAEAELNESMLNGVMISHMCNCPEPLVPPTQKIAQCRFLLQLLAAGLIVISVMGLLAKDYSVIFINMMLIYMLYIGWSQFNWCSILIFFIFCTMSTIQTIILLIGLIQYNSMFQKDSLFLSIYVLMEIFYYPTAVMVSHYAYKHFKALSMEGVGANMNLFPPNQGNQQPANNQYYRVQEPRPQASTNRAFQGQGVPIG